MNEFFPLASAAGMTVGLAVCALIVGLALAMFFAVWESAKWRPVAWAGSALVTILRGLPEILVVLFIYFGSSQLLLTLSDGFTINLGFVQIPVQMDIENFDVSPFLCGVIALSLLYAAYASQTLRGALKAVPVGQWESGQALGLSKSAIFFRLVMPQMWRHALPGLGNQWLVLLKDTALVSLISVNDLMLQTKSIDHPIIPQVIANDYEAMVGGQLAERQMFHYPPYYRLVYVYLKNRNETLLDLMAQTMAAKLRTVFGNRVLGPDKPPVARVQTLFIRKIVLKIETNAPMARARELLVQVQKEMVAEDRFKSLIVYYDVDPM